MERLGRAAVELLAQDGFAALTVRMVAAEAGVGAGSQSSLGSLSSLNCLVSLV